MINITRWSPDTCNCVIEYSWDAETSEDDRVHRFHQVVEQCEEHAGIEKHQDVHSHVLAENQTKNRVEGSVFDHVSRLKHKTVDPQGNVQIVLHPSVQHVWKFVGKDSDRHLESTFLNANFTSDEVAKLKSVISTFDKSVNLDYGSY